jgi:hypothetical protein
MGNLKRGTDGRFLPAKAADVSVDAAGGETAGNGGVKRAAAASKRKTKAKKAARAKSSQVRWPKEKEAIFFRELSIVCNVAAALRAAGLVRHKNDIYARRSEPAFRARWEEALAESRVLMALELHERARFGDQRPEPANEIEAKLRAVPTALALQLLKLYEGRAAKAAAGAAAAPAARRDPERRRALRRELLERLAEFNRRMGGEG